MHSAGDFAQKDSDEESYIPGIPIPFSIPPMVDCMVSSIFRLVPLMAAVTRSCNISTSPLFTTSGSILTLNTCLRPFILTTTLPPPEEPSTTVSSIFFCRTSYCRLACDINSCRLNPPIVDPQLVQYKVQRRFPLCTFVSFVVQALPFFLQINNRPNFRSELF